MRYLASAWPSQFQFHSVKLVRDALSYRWNGELIAGAGLKGEKDGEVGPFCPKGVLWALNGFPWAAGFPKEELGSPELCPLCGAKGLGGTEL
mmetsp:Transcript_30933/g.51091  ORF Transcript_30933/g.51091 Transcript_30933/m.51091 type:complete len:92 (+) Transcript_30933:25-300(+)